MDLTKIDELDARQKALDEERAQARKAVLKEIQYLRKLFKTPISERWGSRFV